MNKQEFIEAVKASSLSADSQAKILQLLDTNELDFDTKELIKDIIQADIESGAYEFLSADEKKALADADDQADVEIQAVEKGLTDDMAFVETELNDLAAMVADLDKVVDQVEIAELNSDIKTMA